MFTIVQQQVNRYVFRKISTGSSTASPEVVHARLMRQHEQRSRISSFAALRALKAMSIPLRVGAGKKVDDNLLNTVRRLPELRRRTQVKVASTVGKYGGEVLHNRVWNHTQACLFATLLGHETLCSIREDKHSSLEINN
jgi:hypothetical protein